MPIEIKELVIRAVVSDEKSENNTSEEKSENTINVQLVDISKLDDVKKGIVEECTKEIWKKLKKKKK